MKVIIEYPKNTRKWRTVNVTIHSKDLWSGDVTLAYIIHPFLVKYRNLYNEPNPMTSYPYGLELDQWITILDTMIYAFKWIKEDSTFGPHGKQIGKEISEMTKQLKIDERFDAMNPVFEKYKTELENHEAKIKEGLRFFGEYFQSLWT